MKISSHLLYGADECLERIQTYACKRYMNIGQNACNAAVPGGCNRFPMYITTAERALKYWLKTFTMPSDRFVKKCYLMMINEDRLGCTNWASALKELLFMNGFGYIWNNQGVRNVSAFIKVFDQRLLNGYIHTRLACLYRSTTTSK